MAFLTSRDFKKAAGSGPYSGESRSNCIRKMIRDGHPFYLNQTGGGSSVFGILYETKNETLPGVLTYCKSKSKIDDPKYHLQIPATKVFKSPFMGGGASGSGGGERATKIQECFQCYVCSYVFNIKKGAIDCIPPKDELAKASRFVHADAKLSECFGEITDTWIEEKTYVRTANKLYSWASKFRGKVVHFHRGSDFMKNLYKAKKEVHRLDRKSEKAQAPGSFSDDKWNPGDIWMTTMNSSDKPLNNCTSWGELKHKVLEFADAGKLLGVSLKKLEKTGETVKEFNRVKLSDTSWIEWNWGNRGDFFSSQDIYLTVNGVKIQFRTFNGISAWQGEVKGTGAAGGKIGGGNVDFYLKENSMTELYKSESSFLNQLKDDEKMNKFLYQGYKTHSKNAKGPVKKYTEDEFMEIVKTKDAKFKASKSICIAFLNSTYEQTSNRIKRNNLATALYNYASSATDQSSYFIKIS